MKRAGFTMIELIFVIVILGILASVAVPKLIGVKGSADIGVCDSFYGTLNRTVGPSLWANMALNDTNESVEFTVANLEAQIDIDGKCGTAAQISAAAINGTPFQVNINGTNHDVNVTQASGNATPTWAFTK